MIMKIKFLFLLLVSYFLFSSQTTIRNKGSVSQGLIAFYPLDEAGGGTVFDMKKVLNLTLASTEWTNLDKTMYVHTNGNTCGATTPDNTPLDIRTDKISFGGWIYPIVSNVYQVICGKIYDQTNRQYAIYLSATGTTGMYMSLNGVWANQAITISNPYVVNKWNHIMLTYDGANIYVYVNGVRSYTKAITGNITNYPNSKFQIGAEGTPSAGFYRCTGRLKNIGVWNRALTISEIDNLYKLGAYRNPFKK